MLTLTAEDPSIILDGYLQVDGATEDAAAASTTGRSMAQRVSAMEWRTEQVQSCCTHAFDVHLLCEELSMEMSCILHPAQEHMSSGHLPKAGVYSSAQLWHLEVRHCPGSNSMHSGQPPGDMSCAAGPLRAGRCAGDGWPS